MALKKEPDTHLTCTETAAKIFIEKCLPEILKNQAQECKICIKFSFTHTYTHADMAKTSLSPRRTQLTASQATRLSSRANDTRHCMSNAICHATVAWSCTILLAVASARITISPGYTCWTHQTMPPLNEMSPAQEMTSGMRHEGDYFWLIMSHGGSWTCSVQGSQVS